MRYGSYPYYGFASGFEYLEPDCMLYLDFKGPEVFETNFTGYLFGHAGQIPLVSTGGIVHLRGMDDYVSERRKGIQLANTATNQVLNPVSGAAGNIAAVGASTLQLTSMLKGFLWRTSTRVSTTAAANDGASYSLNAGGLANAIHFASIALDIQLSTQQWSVDGANWHTPVYLGTYNGWYIYGVQLPAAQCNGSVLFQMRQTDATARVFHIGIVQVEQTTYRTAFLHGSMGSGHVWTGAANASTSTRTISQLRYGLDNFDPEQGGFSVWWFNNTCSTGAQYGQSTRRVFEYYYGVNDYIYLACCGAANRLPVFYTLSGGAPVSVVSSTNTPQGWNHLACNWKVDNPLELYLNGVLVGQSVSNYILPAGAATIFTIGDDQGGGNSCDGVLSAFSVFDRNLTSSEILKIYNLGCNLGLYGRFALSECGEVHR